MVKTEVKRITLEISTIQIYPIVLPPQLLIWTAETVSGDVFLVFYF
jgi:hypothetical protein